jgi:DNA-directed RNA polymerase subunit RPC12/RpoP
MNKICKKCGKEIPQSSKKDVCENCQNKKFGKLRKVGGAVVSVGLTIGSLALFVVTKGKSGGPKA